MSDGAAPPDRLTAPQPKTGPDLSDLARRPSEQTGAGDRATPTDRSWWKEIYRAGIKAGLDRKPRIPPEGLTDDQRNVWLAGYDR